VVNQLVAQITCLTGLLKLSQKISGYERKLKSGVREAREIVRSGELGEVGFWKVAKIRHFLATVLVRP